VPQTEWVETQSKARAVLRAAEMAQAGLNSPRLLQARQA
jgi:anthranilate synthase component 1